MCGIAGRFNFRSGAPVDVPALRRMSELLAHRGPDGEGIHVDGPLGLGHRRLSIIDLSEAAGQPMSYDGGRLWIVFNGEIYNYQSLSAELQRGGHCFRTRSDTEVILAAYSEYGLDCLQRFRGMFAFALWDAPRRRLFMARDRVGQKPLHYLLDKDGIAFVSEPRAFLGDLGFEARPSTEAIAHYLSLQYVPTPLSGFDGVRKLPPAHYLVVEDAKVRVERYWRLRYFPKREVDEDSAVDELGERLRETIRLRLISDVPLGAFLSGGVDSSTIVAMMVEAGARPVKTFSIGFEQKEYNELAPARVVARRYATDHHELVVTPDATSILPRLVWHHSEPYADSSAVPTYYLAEFARRHVTVALNGDAGDESFAGYDRYFATMMSSHLDRLPAALRGAIETAAARAPRMGGPKSAAARVKRFLEGLATPLERRYGRWMLHYSDTVKRELCTPAFLESAGRADAAALLDDAFHSAPADNLLDRMLAADVATYLPDDLLVKIDIATMAHGLEGRSPFLDHELMEFAATLPTRFKMRGSARKYLLKRLARRLLPGEIVDRPKMGFAVPLDHWFRDELRDMAHDVLLGARASGRGYFNMPFVRKMLAEHEARTRDWHPQLWNLLMLELWHEMFIDRRNVSATALS